MLRPPKWSVTLCWQAKAAPKEAMGRNHRQLEGTVQGPAMCAVPRQSQRPLWSHTPEHGRAEVTPRLRLCVLHILGILRPAAASPSVSACVALNGEEQGSNSQESPSNSVPGPMLWLRLLTMGCVFLYRPCVHLTLGWGPNLPAAPEQPAASSLDIAMVVCPSCPMPKAPRASHGKQQHQYPCPGPGVQGRKAAVSRDCFLTYIQVGYKLGVFGESLSATSLSEDGQGRAWNDEQLGRAGPEGEGQLRHLGRGE